MARTTPSAVQAILMRDYDTVNSPSLDGFIDSASSIVDRVVLCATDKDISISTIDRELIERWLAAHFYAMSDQPYKEKETERARGVYQGLTGMYFEGTKYGQMAVTLDSSGCLSAIGKRQVAGGFWSGKPPSEQLDYVQRD